MSSYYTGKVVDLCTHLKMFFLVDDVVSYSTAINYGDKRVLECEMWVMVTYIWHDGNIRTSGHQLDWRWDWRPVRAFQYFCIDLWSNFKPIKLTEILPKINEHSVAILRLNMYSMLEHQCGEHWFPQGCPTRFTVSAKWLVTWAYLHSFV